VLTPELAEKYAEIEKVGRLDGYTDTRELFILVDTTQSKVYVADTLFHEILHAVWFVWDIHDRDAEERTIRSASTGMMAVWRDNPGVFRWIDRQL
jgi:hypothetical protein